VPQSSAQVRNAYVSKVSLYQVNRLNNSMLSIIWQNVTVVETYLSTRDPTCVKIWGK